MLFRSTGALGLAAAHAWPGMDGALAGAALLLAGEVFEAWTYSHAARAAAAVPADASSPVVPDAPAEALSRAA